MKKKKLRKSICCLLLCAVLLVPLVSWVIADNDVERGKMREQLIYDFLRDEMGFGENAEAIACGILANINKEVGGPSHNYDPTLYVDDSNGIKSYGICMWNGRKDEIESYFNQTSVLAAVDAYCTKKGYSQEDQYLLVKQLYFLKHDLYESGNFNDTMSRILAVDNTPAGAYYAGFTFCFWYEKPATQSASGYERGINARDIFWKKYVKTAESITTAGTTLTVSGVTCPSGLYGSLPSFVLRGTVNSNKPILNVTATVYDAEGNADMTYTRDWYYVAYNMKWDGMDSNIKFGKLENGSYRYIVTAKDYDSTVHTVVDSVFHIGYKTICTVDYNTDGGGTIAAKYPDFGDTITLPAAPTKAGYVFAGWSDGTAIYPAGGSYQVLSRKVTLTAVWTACQHQYGDTWQHDATNHWHVCTVCGAAGTPEKHSFTDTVTPATPTAQGYTTHTCTVCGYSYVDSYTDYDASVGIAVTPYAPGDVNGDGYLNGRDVAALSRHVAGAAALTGDGLTAANVDGSEGVNAADIVALARRFIRVD